MKFWDVGRNDPDDARATPCRDRPVSFCGVEYIRVGSYTKKLRDFPEKERTLWAKSSQVPFEREVAEHGVRSEEVLKVPDYLRLSGLRVAMEESGVLT